MVSTMAGAAHAAGVAAIRPAADRTGSTDWCDQFDRVDAPPFGWRRVATQACHDLFGTKDVQDAITATYVWMADQVGHIALGFVPTVALCWIATLIIGESDWLKLVYLGIAAAIAITWVRKELADQKDTLARAKGVFPIDSGDIIWNVKTALLYFGIGILFALAAFIWWPLVPVAVLLSLWPAMTVLFWWLRRKLAFQQAGLPYLFRLANFAGGIDADSVKIVGDLANVRAKGQKVGLFNVMFGRDPKAHPDPKIRHLLVSGPLGAGKTSLCVGVGTEFAFSLAKGRYLTATKLVELVVGGDDSVGDRTYEDGLVLWNWRDCDLLVVDDVDAGASDATDAGSRTHLINPATFVAAITANGGRAPLRDFGKRRTVWVVGDADGLAPWHAAIAGLLGVDPDEIAVVQLAPPGGTA